jgi:large subunit ribosomal protein L44e
MKRLNLIKRYCPKCLHHTGHKLAITKKQKPSELRAGQRRFRRSNKGHKGFTRPKPSNNRVIKKQNLIYTCLICKKGHHDHGIIAKKLEIIKK